MAKCPDCGASIIDGDRYCGTCGATLNPSTPPGAAPPGSRFASAGSPFASSMPPPPPATTPWGTPPPSPPPFGAAQPQGAIPTFGPVPDALMPSQSPRARKRWRPWIMASGGVVVAAGLAVLAVMLLGGNSRHYPSKWDPQVAPIAASVEALRGLTFKHPVQVEYLSPADFTKQVTATPDDLKKNSKEIEQATAVFRATGLIGGNVDLGKAINDTSAADVIALYDPDSKKILVRGTGPFTIETRVTLAHELTHVLQDQYFDLNKLDKEADDSKTGSSDALDGLVEGDAVRIQNKYLDEQSATDRAEYERLSNATSDAADAQSKDVPFVVQTYFGAPYVYGPQVVSILESTGGNQAIDAALTGPTPTTRMYLDPTAVNQVPSTPPPLPALRPGEKKLSSETADDEELDDFTLYLMLSARLDPVTALRAADAYAAGSMTAYTSDGTTCFRASVTGVNDAGDAFLAQVLSRWTRLMPQASMDSTVRPVTFESCDPGKGAVAPSNNAIRSAASLAATRDSMTQSLITNEHAPSYLATCAARLLIQMPSFRAIMNENTAAAFQQGARDGAQAALACRQNPQAGIP